jgi:hypothetical protein
MTNRWLSAKIKTLNLPSDLYAQMERELWKEDKTTPGSGKFLYMLFFVLVPTDGHPRLVGGETSISLGGFGDLTLIGKDEAIEEIVGVLFKKPVRQPNIKAKRGDTSFQLRSEWNEDENPV